MLAIGSRFDRHEVEDQARHASVMNGIGSHSVRLTDLEDAKEVTGIHELEKLRAEKAKLETEAAEKSKSEKTKIEDEATWRRRWLLGILGTVLAALSVGGLTWIVARAVYATPPAQAAPR